MKNVEVLTKEQMKKIIFLTLILSGFHSFLLAQKDYFELNGEVNEPYSGKVHLLCGEYIGYSNKEVCSAYPQDSTDIVIGRFSFKGTIQYPHLAMLEINGALSEPFFLQKGIQRVKIDSFKWNIQLNITGSAANDEYTHDYLKLMQKPDSENNVWILRLREYQKLYGKTFPDSITVKNNNEKKRILNERDSLFLSYIRKNSHSYVSLWMMTHRFSINGYSPIYDLYFKTLSDEIRNSYTGQVLNKRLNAAKDSVSVGKRFAQLNLIDSNGRSIVLNPSTQKAKFFLVDFWFSHCIPCIGQFPELKNISSEYKQSEFKIIGVSIDEKKDENTWKSVIKKQGLTWENYLDINGVEADRLNISHFPTNFLLNEKGQVVQRDISPEILQLFLKQNLN